VTDLDTALRTTMATHLDVSPETLQPGTRLREDLRVDSLSAIELSMVLEDEFDIALPEEVMADVRTYGDVLAIVAARAGPAPGTGPGTGNGSA
jgi:acyl carrier protein